MSNTLKTSKEWYDIKRITEPKFVIMDPDGWNRQNYEYSFNEELITQDEFNMRVGLSTCLTFLNNE
jgi:hypothetical protein